MARFGNRPAVLNPGNVVTGLSTQVVPLGSVVNGTRSQRATRIESNELSSCGMKILFVVGETSTLPMMPSAQGAEMRLAGPNDTPAVGPAPSTGERKRTRRLFS